MCYNDENISTVGSNPKRAGLTQEILVLNKCPFIYCYGTLLKLCPPHGEICLPAPPQSLLFLSFIAFSFLFMDVQPWGEEGRLEFGEGGGHSLRWAARGQSVFSESQTEHTHTQGAAPPTHPRTNSHTVRRRGKWMCAAPIPRLDAFSEALKTHREGKCWFLDSICI